MKVLGIAILCLLSFTTPVFGYTAEDVINVLTILDFFLSDAPSAVETAPVFDDAELYFEELQSGQVKIMFQYPENADVYFTTDGRTATQASPKYQSPIIVDVGTEINWLTVYDDDQTTASSMKIIRNENPELVVENNAQFGTMIALQDNSFLSDLPICFSIIPTEEFRATSQYKMKSNFHWQEYLSPIILADIPFCDFVVAYVIPASNGKLSSDVLYQEFNKYPGACFNYVFYDKGMYSDDWRYIEICPIVQEGIYCTKGLVTGAVYSDLGQGLENTLKITRSSEKADTSSPDKIAAQNALEVVYVNKDDWYLPTIDELEKAYEVYPELFSRISDYWSSTEKNSDKAYTLRWNRDKDTKLKYFVVRRF